MPYCIIIKENIVVSTCPLPQKSCYWQHRETYQCCYTDEELALADYCNLVGAEIPENLEVVKREFVQQLKLAI